MTWAETRSNLTVVSEMLKDALKDKYSFNNDSDGIRFLNNAGEPFNIFAMGNEPPWNFYVVEYENTGEDGDAFYPEDYSSFNELLGAMLKEIEG